MALARARVKSKPHGVHKAVAAMTGGGGLRFDGGPIAWASAAAYGVDAYRLDLAASAGSDRAVSMKKSAGKRHEDAHAVEAVLLALQASAWKFSKK